MLGTPVITPHKPLTKATFKRFAALVYERVGIVLGANKEALVSARLAKRMRALGISDYADYYDYVSRDNSGTELTQLIDAISTNVTHFYRESRHFDVLSSLLEQWESGGQHRFRIWCTAASTGEEPYSIAITLREALQDCRDAKILATDISTKVLAKASQGQYSPRALSPVPAGIRQRYFRRLSQTTAEEATYEVDASLKRMIRFGRVNLAKPPFPLKGPLDVVFCRNVMIYFDNETRRRLLAEAYRLLKPGGYLMVGHAESLSGMLSEFQSIEPSVYIKPARG